MSFKVQGTKQKIG